MHVLTATCSTARSTTTTSSHVTQYVTRVRGKNIDGRVVDDGYTAENRRKFEPSSLRTILSRSARAGFSRSGGGGRRGASSWLTLTSARYIIIDRLAAAAAVVITRKSVYSSRIIYTHYTCITCIINERCVYTVK